MLKSNILGRSDSYIASLETSPSRLAATILRGERGHFVLPPARPPFFFASDGLVGLGCEGNGWLSPRRRSLGPSRFRVVFPAGGRKVEASSVQWNKVLWPSLRLVVNRSGAGDGLVRLGFVGFEDQVGAPDLGESCTGVCLLSSLVLLVLFLMFLEACVAVSGLGWFTLFGVVEDWEGVSRSKSPTAEVLSLRISCSFPICVESVL